MTIPAISVVIPLFNKEKEVERALRSVQTQTFQDFEVIIVNDGSTDGSRETIESFAGRLGGREEERFRIIDQENQGAAAARNRGIEGARAELVAFLDADDEWLPQFLETIIRLKLNFPKCNVFATNYITKESDDVFLQTRLRGLPTVPWEGVIERYFRVAARSDPPIGSSAMVVTKRAVISIGGFPIGITSGEDLLTWARLATRYQIAYSAVPQAIFWQRIEISSKPRVPQNPDIVGAGLAALVFENVRYVRDVKRYIGLWHRMRANCYLRLSEHSKARKEIRTSVSYDRWAWKTYAYLLAAHLPWVFSFRSSTNRRWLMSGSANRAR